MKRLAALFALALAATPQARRDPDPHIVVDVQRVDVLFTVTDKRGRFITNLTRDHFEVAEDGRAQKILGFATPGELPLRLAVVLDASNSIRERFRFIQEAAVEFLTSAVRPKLDQAVVMSFDTRVDHVTGLKDDPAALAAAIRALRPGGGTALYDAIYNACRGTLPKDEPGRQVRRAIVVLSDGDDNQSYYTREQTLQAAQKSNAVIYAVSTNEGRIETHGDKVLRYLAVQTGGTAFFPFRTGDLARSFQQVASELRHQYNVFYRPEPMRNDGRFHSMTVRVKGRKDLVVKVRSGYYAPAP